MKYVKPENSNFTFGAGDNPGTGDLDVTMAFRHDIPGRVFSISEWELTDEELAEIIRTRRVFLSVMGAGMMPVSVLGFNPFEQEVYYEALVIDEQRGESTIKKIVDPQEEQSFMRWMELVSVEVENRPFFSDKEKILTKHAPLETWRSMYLAGSTYTKCVDSLQRFIEHKVASQN